MKVQFSLYAKFLHILSSSIQNSLDIDLTYMPYMYAPWHIWVVYLLVMTRAQFGQNPSITEHLSIFVEIFYLHMEMSFHVCLPVPDFGHGHGHAYYLLVP